MRGLFITFEGGEGVGKSTQQACLQRRLQQMGLSVCSTREPGGCPLGAKLRAIVLGDPLCPQAELLLYLADRAQHIHEFLRPRLSTKQIVLCDRFIDSSEVYQGITRGLGQPLVRSLHKWLLPDVFPQLTLLLDLPPQEGLRRVLARGEAADRLESENLDFHQSVRQGFLQQARNEPERIKVIDARGGAEEVHARIWQQVEPCLRAWREQ